MSSAAGRLIVVWLLLAGVLHVEADDDPAAFVRRLGNEAVSSGKTVGLSIGIARGDALIFAQGFGLANQELNVPVTTDTVFRIGSITKEFTAAAVLLLVEDGRIDLDTPIRTYLPTYPEAGGGVTVRHLLHHTSGIRDFTRLPEYRRNRPIDVTPEEVLARFANLPLEFVPGEKHRYCNSGYFLLAVLIERVSGRSFRDFVEQRLLFKLGMRRTWCDSAARIIPNRAAGYSKWGDRLRNASTISLSQTTGAGNLASTASDLIIWQRGIMKHRLINSASIESMRAKGKLNNGSPFNYGFGLRITRLDGHQVLRHGGGISGFRADLAYYPASEFTLAVLANCDGFNTARLSDQIARFLLASSP